MADFDLNGILSSLSSEDINNLKNIAGSILGGEEKRNSESVHQKDNSGGLNGLGNIDFSSLGLPNMNELSKLLPLISEFNKHDEREDFLCALKPLLSEERRKKADEAVKLIKLVSLIPILKEKGIM